MEERTLRTGELARSAGVNPQTLRYYERRGLLAPPLRTRGNYRAYPAHAVGRVRFIKAAQLLGFTLREIEDLLSLQDDVTSSCEEVRSEAQEKVAEIELKIAALSTMRDALETLVRSCDGGEGSTRSCPILEAIKDHPILDSTEGGAR